jgi:hypothetical protein
MTSFRTMANIPFDTSCKMFCIHITKIAVSHIQNNTVSVNEHTVSVQCSMQFLITRLLVIVLQRVEEQFVVWRKIIVCVSECVCVQTEGLL